MGGYGSGRQRSTRSGAVEDFLSLDVNRLKRAGLLQSGQTGLWQFSKHGAVSAYVVVTREKFGLRLTYQHRCREGDREEIEQPIPVIWVPCRFGGRRPYFICPGIVDRVPCEHRVIKLYKVDRYFLCRHCYRLACASQSENTLDRALRRRDKLKQNIWGENCSGPRRHKRPKGMWRSTYARLRTQLVEAEMLADELFEAAAEQLCARLERSRDKW